MALTNYAIGGTSANAGGTETIQTQDSAARYRYYELSQYLEGATGVNGFTQVRAGVLTAGSLDNTTNVPNALKLTASGSGLNLSIARGSALVQRSTPNGVYRVVSYAAATVTLGTADATNPRIDRIDLQVFDGALGDNSGTSLTQFVVTQGTAAASPVAPAAPSNSIPLGHVLLAAATATITAGMVFDDRKSTALRGAVRVLLPGDSLSDAGFHVGEMRNTIGVTTPASMDWWSTTGTAWVPFVDLSGAAPVESGVGAGGSTSSTTYVAPTSNTGVVFTAPISGRVRLDWQAGLNIGVGPASQFAACSIQVSAGGSIGSGTVVVAASDNWRFQSTTFAASSAADEIGSSFHLVTGLTPGATYNAYAMFRASSASPGAAIHSIRVLATPA